MPELLNNIDELLGKAIEYEHNLMNVYVGLIKAYDGLGNENATDGVLYAGLKIPNFYMFVQEEKVHKEELENIKFAVETKIKDNDDREKRKMKR